MAAALQELTKLEAKDVPGTQAACDMYKVATLDTCSGHGTTAVGSRAQELKTWISRGLAEHSEWLRTKTGTLLLLEQGARCKLRGPRGTRTKAGAWVGSMVNAEILVPPLTRRPGGLLRTPASPRPTPPPSLSRKRNLAAE